MTDRPADDDRNARIDPERPHEPKPFDKLEGQFGQQYGLKDELAEGRAHPSGEVKPGAAGHERPPSGVDIPPDNGRRASFDPRTGEVHGSGVGAGGGAEGEDFETDPVSGAGYPMTGVEQQPDDVPGHLGPPRFKE